MLKLNWKTITEAKFQSGVQTQHQCVQIALTGGLVYPACPDRFVNARSRDFLCPLSVQMDLRTHEEGIFGCLDIPLMCPDMTQVYKGLTQFLAHFLPLSPLHLKFTLLLPMLCTQTLGIGLQRSSRSNPTQGTSFLALDCRFY